MLSYNADREARYQRQACAKPCAAPAAPKAASRAHAAHALVLGIHTLCCGAPVVATLLASGALGLAGLAVFEGAAHELHASLHRHEGWILAVSAALVAVGGMAEWLARRRGQASGFPAFFAVSLACLALNASLVVSHRMATPEAHIVSAPVVLDHGHSHDHQH